MSHDPKNRQCAKNNTTCLVYHPDGICPDAGNIGSCNCPPSEPKDWVEGRIKDFQIEYRKAYAGILPEEVLAQGNPWFENFIRSLLLAQRTQAVKARELEIWEEVSLMLAEKGRHPEHGAIMPAELKAIINPNQKPPTP